MRTADRREGPGRDPEAWLLPFESGGLAMTTFGTLYKRLRPR